MVNVDGSTITFYELCKSEGVGGVVKTWPMPTLYALEIILTFGAFEAFLQLFVPGGIHVGPVSPAGNRPVYKVYNFGYCLMFKFFLYAQELRKQWQKPDHVCNLLCLLTLNILNMLC